MNKKTTLLLILGIIVLFLGFSLKADEKDEKWINRLIEQSSPNTRLPGGGAFGELGSMENPELSLLVEHNINAHFMKIAKLCAQGWSESEIAAQFETKLAQTQIGTSSISGKLTEKRGGVIKHYASVAAFNEFGHYCGFDYSAYFNNGRYRISNLLPGKYYVRVSSYSYQDQYYRNSTDWRKAKKVRVQKNKTTRNINFKLKIVKESKPEKIEGNGAISGQVKRKDGTPLKECLIGVFNLDHERINSSTTDANGQYVVPNLPTGKYKVLCLLSESGAYMQIWYGNARYFDEASVVTVTDPKTTPNINFILELGGIIKGKVLGADGKPLSGYECNIFVYDMQEELVWVGLVDPSGKFALGFLPKGRYKLHAVYYGRENNISCWYKKTEKFKSATPIRVNPGQIINITFKLKRGGIITGTVTNSNGQSLSVGCDIVVFDEDGLQIKYRQVDENGVFRIHGLATGRYKLYAGVYYYLIEGGPQPASEWYNGKYSYKDAAFVKVTAPKTRSNINFSLSLGGYIMCRVLDSLGNPLGLDASVYAYNSRRERVSSASIRGYDGRFALNGLPSGKYKVRAVYYGDEDYLSEFYDNKRLFEVAEYITVTAPNGTENIIFELDYAGVLQGFLTDAKKKRVIDEENHPVEIYAFDAETGEFAGFTDNTFVSGYHMELLEGKYKLATLSFYYNWMSSADDFGVTYHPQGKKFNDPVTKTHSAKPGSAKKLTSLVLKKPKGSISGTIYDKTSGLAMTKGLYFVWVFDADGFLVSLSGYTDSNKPISGEYRIGGLRPGNYYVLVIAINEFSDLYKLPWEWYGGIEMPQDELYNFTPKMDIPAGAAPVSVGTDDTGGIDFYLDIEK